tara:strand:- start:379 stop:579 length:201 start_codon:yes stop_codon:yes gene_type:complete
VYKKRRKKMSDRLDEAVSKAFKELYKIEQLVLKLRLTLGHLEEVSKKNRNELKEIKRKEPKEYEGV